MAKETKERDNLKHKVYIQRKRRQVNKDRYDNELRNLNNTKAEIEYSLK